MKQKSPHTLKPLSLHPLSPEEALRLFMRVKPKRIEAEIGKLMAGLKEKGKNGKA